MRESPTATGGEPDRPDGYTGPALVTVGDGPVLALEVQLAGHFEPISGRYRWQGRVRGLTEALGAADPPAPGTELEIETPEGTGTARVTAVDLWGSHLVRSVSGRPFGARPQHELD
ncbi:DUF4873 domain-containing protein [Rhodococcus kronopolitis]|uniref:DUF4873 domain-containing protein n=1 Tax=Rhodococcus kronopolitis TaxID=1460226 RepID=A0ABV9FWS2_9NOCA